MTNWQTKKLGEVCDLQNGYAFKSNDYVGSSNTLNFRMSNIRPGGFVDIYHNQRFLPDDYILKYKDFLLKDGDLVIAMTDMATETKILGVPTIVQTEGKRLLLNQRVGKFFNIKSDKIYIPFLKYMLSSEQVNNYYKSLGRGGLQINIGKQDILNVEIPSPSISEQKRVVGILDEIFDKVVKAKESTEKNLQNSNELFESYLYSVFANPGKDWEEKRLKEIGETQTGLTPKTANREYYGSFVPFITPADVDISGDGSIRYDSKGLSEEGLRVGRKIEKNSILMVCIGATIGKIGFTTEVISCNQQINTLTPLNKYEAKIFYYILSTRSFFSKVIKGSSQATLPIINKGKWENLLVSFPKSLSEQKSIVKKLDALSEQTKKLESIYWKKLENLEELKKSVLQKAFSGEL